MVAYQDPLEVTPPPPPSPPPPPFDEAAMDLDPRYVRPGKGWTQQMFEMADHIGALSTLLLSQALGGRQVYIPADFQRISWLRSWVKKRPVY